MSILPTGPNAWAEVRDTVFHYVFFLAATPESVHDFLCPFLTKRKRGHIFSVVRSHLEPIAMGHTGTG
jgi:hypothetical protein